MRVIFGFLLALVLGAVAMAAWIASGRYDISAREGASPATERLADWAKRQSVRAHAQHITAPPLADPILIEDGARHYRDHCVQCHGAPGAPSADFARAMRPEPTDLAKSTGWTSAQTFWIIQNGLKMSGMPAYHATMVDGEIWGVVAFVEQLPQMDPAKYQAMTAPPPPAEPEAPPPAATQDVVPPNEGEEAPSVPEIGPPPPADGAAPAPEVAPAPAPQ
jgi:mono/diheme cytochrome c family protein